ncbi:hypothetical protein AB0L53_09355 [Nonomuraea sp. NPDC052129]|uniref:hypothetical protein n=1 Tax=Nonomuraea sp. NPDC052129 TaxID=3154651 RepID=UPI003440521E
MGLLTWIKELLAPAYDSPPVSYHTTSSFIRSLASSLDKAYFTASLELTWISDGPGQPPSEDTYDVHRGLRKAIESATRNFSVLLLEEAQAQADFAARRAARTIDSNVVSARVILSVDEKTKLYAENYEDIVRTNALTEADWQMRAQQARYIRDHLLVDAQMARLWWLDGQSGKLPELLRMGSDFEKIVALVQSGAGMIAEPEETAKEERIAHLIREFLDPLGPQHREVLLSQLGSMFTSYDRSDLADRLNEVNGDSTTT